MISPKGITHTTSIDINGKCHQILQLGGYSAGGVPGRGEGGTLLGRGVPCRGVPCRGGTLLGQQKEYSLHGGRYASCVHAGGLSCFMYFYHRHQNTTRYKEHVSYTYNLLRWYVCTILVTVLVKLLHCEKSYCHTHHHKCFKFF